MEGSTVDGVDIGVFYYHTDHLGSSSVVTDCFGQEVSIMNYRPFGSLAINRSVGKNLITHKYTGQELDEESNLYYYNSRYYDPEVGRFLTADSIVPDPTELQHHNRYSYVINNPIRYTDPTGHGLCGPWDNGGSGCGPSEIGTNEPPCNTCGKDPVPEGEEDPVVPEQIIGCISNDASGICNTTPEESVCPDCTKPVSDTVNPETLLPWSPENSKPKPSAGHCSTPNQCQRGAHGPSWSPPVPIGPPSTEQPKDALDRIPKPLESRGTDVPHSSGEAQQELDEILDKFNDPNTTVEEKKKLEQRIKTLDKILNKSGKNKQRGQPKRR